MNHSELPHSSELRSGGLRSSKTWCYTLISMACMVYQGSFVPVVYAQTQIEPGISQAGAHYAIQIAAQPLSSALKEISRQTGIQILADSAIITGYSVEAISGEMNVEEALRILLQSTGLRSMAQQSGIVAIVHGNSQLQETANQSSLSDANNLTLDEVVITAPALESISKDDAYRAPLSTSTMDRDDIERNRGSSVGDIFRGMTGVLVGENRNSGGLDINIRGMQGQGRVPILVDGARQETTVWRGYSGVASRSYIDPDLIGGIQVDKGPTLSAQGTGATGGLVSARTINVDDIVRPGQTFGLRLRGQAIGNNTGSPIAQGTPSGLFVGQFTAGAEALYRTDCVTATICAGEYALPSDWGYADGLNRPGTLSPRSWAGSIAVAKRWEKIDLVAAYAKRQQGNYYAGKHGPTAWMDISDQRRRPFYTEVRPVIRGASPFQSEERIPGTNYESESTLLKGKLYLPNDDNLELSYLRYTSAYSEIMPSQIIRFGTFEPIMQPKNSDITVDTYTSRYRWTPTDNPLLDLRTNLWYTRSRSTNNNPGNEELAVIYINEKQTYDRWGLDVENTSILEHGRWGSSQLRFGLSVQREEMDTIPLSDDVPELMGHAGKRDEYSLFTAWQYKPVSTVTLDAGMRHSRFKTSDDKPIVIRNTANPYCVDANGDGECDPLINRNKDHGTTPVISLSYEPGNRGLQFYGRYAEAKRMPSLFESTSGFSVEASPDVILKPEHTKNREIGINYLKDGAFIPHDRLRLKFAYFRNHTTDYLTRTNANQWEHGGGDSGTSALTTALVMRNIDSATFGGLEFSGTYDMGLFFTEFGATKYNKIEICYTGSYRVNVCNNYGIANSYINNMVPPNWHGNLTLGTRLLDRKLTLGVRGIFMGQRNNTPEYNNDTTRGFLAVVPWHSYKVFDFFAKYKVNDSVSVDFNLDNFTDRYYLDALGLGLIPAPGRTARLGVTLQF